MSKLFEALKKAEAEGRSDDAALPVVIDEMVDLPHRAPALEGSNTRPEVVISVAGPAAVTESAVPSASQPGTSTGAPSETGAEPASLEHVGSEADGTVAIRLSAGAPILPFDGSGPRAGEQYRIIRTKIIQHPRQPRMIVISSAAPQDGKTVNAINIAGALALTSDSKVLLVDADFRNPSIAPVLGLAEGPGLADVLSGACQLENAIIRVQQFPNLNILRAGKPIANPAELLDSPRWVTVCDTLRQRFKFTIFDAPPIAAVADYDLIQLPCDGVVIVVRPDHTNRGRFFQALDMVSKEKLIGIVINCVKEWFLWKTQDYSYYHVQTAPKVV